MFGGDYDKELKKRQKRFDMMSKFVMFFIIAVFVVVMISWIAMGWVAINLADEVDAQGLKPVAERIWCGRKKPNCLDVGAAK
jgi:hypothetical protein